MTIRPIVIAGDPVLHTPTQPVTEDISELRELIEDMYETMARWHVVVVRCWWTRSSILR